MTRIPEISDDRETPYYAAIGRFITSYAKAEAAVHLMTRTYSDMSDDKARIVFSGMRLPELAIRLRGLLRLTKGSSAEMKDNIEKCLDQLQIIAEERNKIVHRFIEIDGRRPLKVTNIFTAKSEEGHEEHFFTTDELYAMEIDCIAIYSRFLLMRPANRHQSNSPSLQWIYDAWRHKRARPKSQKKSPQKVHRRANRQPPSSRG